MPSPAQNSEISLRYENPFITATSRSVISDIYSLARQLCYVDIPKPLAMLFILFRLKPPDKPRSSAGGESWFQGLRVWTEIGEICESESFGESPIFHNREPTWS